MRINEYNSLKEFTDEYTGVWSPSSGHWLGLDFKYQDVEYRLHTGAMYNSENTILPDGRIAKFGIYYLKNNEYELIGEYADMNDVLEKCMINGKKFKDVIMADSTEILGKD